MINSYDPIDQKILNFVEVQRHKKKWTILCSNILFISTCSKFHKLMNWLIKALSLENLILLHAKNKDIDQSVHLHSLTAPLLLAIWKVQ